MEPLLHFGPGGGDAGRRAVANDAGRFCRIVPGTVGSACCHRSGDTLRLGTEVVVGHGHEVLVANPRLMEGTKRRKPHAFSCAVVSRTAT
jgi:hypothetical protein